MLKNPTITIVGCGAVGQYYGAMLAKSGLSVRFLLRSDYEYVRQNGIDVRSIRGDFHVPVQACKDPSECRGSDLIFVSLKTTARDYLADLLPQIAGPSSYVFTVQNGLGNEEFISRFVPVERIIGGVAFVCLNRVSQGCVSHTAFGMLKAQEMSPESDPSFLLKIQELFTSAGIDFIITDSLKSIKWEKLVWNIPFNGLSGALGGADTQTLLKHKPTYALIEALMKEVLANAHAQGIPLQDSLIIQNIEKTLPMGPYLTSMALDRKHGNALEAETIVGEPLRRGLAKGLKLPYTEALYASLSYYNQYLTNTSKETR